MLGLKVEDFLKVSSQKYTGTVVSSHNGYSFIGGIKRGYETINTNGHVFVPREFLPGEVVEFDTLAVDHQRSDKENKKLFRTEIAAVVSSDNVPAVINMSPSEIILHVNEKRNDYHGNAKLIDPEKVQLAAENRPFAEVIEEVKKLVEDPSVKDMKIEEIAEDFMRRTFVNLASLGVSYNITGKVDRDAEKKAVADLANEYKKILPVQANNITDEYSYFSGVREVFGLMHSEGILRMDAVLPMACLPDLLVMSPVWMIGGKNQNGYVQYFCDQVQSSNFDFLFQMYNSEYRNARDFNSRRDIMPVPIMKVLSKATTVFDVLAVATPYHDMVLWGRNWMRNIDPFLVGFVKGLPLMFLLGRWSGIGLFPRMCDMVADTMDHVGSNLKKIEEIGNVDFYNSKARMYTKVGGPALSAFSQKMLEAYNKGKLFDFLRGEAGNANAVTKQ